MDATYKEERPPNPREKANVFEIVTHSWIFTFVKKGLKNNLNIIDLYKVLDEDSSAILGNKLQKLWNDELVNAALENRKPSFLRTVNKMFGARFILLGVYATIIQVILGIGISSVIGQIVMHFEPKTSSVRSSEYTAIFSTIILISLLLTKIIFFNRYELIIAHIAMRMRVATCDIIYKKALRLKSNSMYQTSTGQIVNLMSNDVNRFDLSLLYLPFLWIGPLETIIAIYFLWQEVGVSSLLGVGTLVIFIPLQVWLGSMTSGIRLETAKRTDIRVCLMNEIISGLKVIKMYAWEPFFNKLTQFARKKEINKIILLSYIKGILSSFFLFNSRIALFVNLFSYVMLGNNISASKVFVIMSYYNILRGSMTICFPPGIGLAAELLVSIKRIENFLLCEENDIQQSTNQKKTTNGFEKSINGDITLSNDNYGSNQNGTEQPSNFGIVISNATAKWSYTQTDNTLENIYLTVRPGRLAAIIGPVGAGKSSLIQAILRELSLSEGNISVHGVVSYASQEPWLFAGSVQQNILFGSPMDMDRYKRVIKVCALNTDLEQFPHGDRTTVGERGVSLSGGQRARINLARAIYRQADIYLLDDPLSAVDTRVGKYIFDKCIKSNFAVHLNCTQYFSNGIILKCNRLPQRKDLYTDNPSNTIPSPCRSNRFDGKFLAEGSYQELQNSGLDFTKLLGLSTEKNVSPDKECKTKNSITSHKIAGAAPYIRQESVSSVASSVDETKTVETLTEPVETAEHLSSGNVSFNVFLSYIFSGGHFYKIFSLLMICILTQGLASGGDYWIAYWVNLEEHVFRTTKPLMTTSSTITSVDSSDGSMSWIVSRQTCIIVFCVLAISIIISALVESALFVSLCTTASINLHNQMFNSITRSTMDFLNKNPSGRILNRFSKDIGIIDEVLPNILVDVVQMGSLVIGILIVVVIVNPYLILPTTMIVLFFFKIKHYYITTTRKVKCLEGVTKSPVFTHLNASLQGLSTIRAFEVEQILSKEFSEHQDLHSSAWCIFITLNKSFAFWLDISCLFYISTVTVFFIFIGNDKYSGNVGLAITQVIGLASSFQWVVRLSAELENQMTSVERVLEYIKLPQESALESSPEKKPPIDWPNEGQITFKTYYLRYDSDEPAVLKNLNILIQPTQKIGIVGRTGAGKSSLIAAIFRLALNEGNIIIDDIEIHGLGLHDLRSKISIIPQEPVLFSGTMRNNLDPFDEYPDHVLWKALDEVKLKDVVEDLLDGLNSKMSEGGSNFSVGQRQLVCLARAILRNNRILVLDEATANVDPQTDALIQTTIRNKFSECTVLTIAHRLNTVMDSDKILVMDAGTMVEFDHPYSLLQKKDGYLFKMVEQTGIINAALIHNIANENYKNLLMTI